MGGGINGCGVARDAARRGLRVALVERERLLRTAPHLVRPLHLVIPVRRGGPFGATRLRAGMLAYDLLSAGKSLDRHRMLGRAAAAAFEPCLLYTSDAADD